MKESIVPATKTRPPAVTMGPPKLGEPGGTGAPGAKLPREPSGTCHRILPSVISTAVSVPHGGAPHGSMAGENIGLRYMAYGAPVCGAYSPRSPVCAAS